MTDDNEDTNLPRHTYNVFVTRDSIESPDIDTPEKWIQRATVLITQALELAALTHMAIAADAPLVLAHSMAGSTLPGLGFALQAVQQSAQAFMVAHGIEVLDWREEQKKAIRNRLTEDISEDEREALLDVLARTLNEEGKPTPEWPDVVGEGDN